MRLQSATSLFCGYVYDTDTKLYYCNSRYYDPAIGWWINADGVIADVGGDIMFIPDKESKATYWGKTRNFGVGTPGTEVLVEWGTTGTIPRTSFNLFDVAKSVYTKIMEW